MTGRAGPGPGAYMLPPTVGYINHDPSKFRNPNYSMGLKGGRCGAYSTPGPNYDLYGMTRYGKASPPGFTISSRHKQCEKFNTPGPGNYSISPEKVMPAYSISSRHPALSSWISPAPNQYPLPSMLGPKVPNKAAAAAYSITGNHGLASKLLGPGPASYGETPTDNYKQKPPKYTMQGRHGCARTGDKTPGPAAYLPNMPKNCMGGFSFGLKTTNSPYVTADDDVPCISMHKQSLKPCD